MMIAEIKISVGILVGFIKSIKKIIPMGKNLWQRPKIHIKLKNNIIIIRDNDGLEHHQNYPCILISFESNVKIDVCSIKLNNESYSSIISGDPSFLNQKNIKVPISVTNNRIMPFISKHWLELHQKICWFEINKNEQEVFPLYLNGKKSNFIFSPKKDSLLFPLGNRISLSMNINGIDCEYGISLFDFCKVVINHLAFK